MGTSRSRNSSSSKKGPLNEVSASMDIRRDVVAGERKKSDMGLEYLAACMAKMKGDQPGIPTISANNLSSHRPLGAGAFCEVFKCKLVEDDGVREVAVKMLKDKHITNELAREDLESEADLLWRLKHPNILQIIGKGEKMGKLFIVLECLHKTLASTLPPPAVEVAPKVRSAYIKKWPLSRVLKTSLEFSQALCFLHEEALPGFAVLHRDLKPDNMGWSEDGRLLIFDFGLAKVVPVDTAHDTTPRPMTGQTGSARYMAPEVALNKAYHTPADVHSFGLIVWQLAAHEKPFDGMSFKEHREQVAKKGLRPPVPAEWPADLQDMITSCWDPDQTKRPRSSELVPRMQKLVAECEEQQGTAEEEPKEEVVEAKGCCFCF